MYRFSISYNTLPSYINCVIFHVFFISPLSLLSLSQKSRTHTVSVRVNSYITWYISVFFSFSCISPTLIYIYIYILKKIHKILYSSFDVNHLPPCPSISVNFADKSSDHSTFFLLKSTNPDSLTGRIASGTISILTVAVFSPSGIPCG